MCRIKDYSVSLNRSVTSRVDSTRLEIIELKNQLCAAATIRTQRTPYSRYMSWFLICAKAGFYMIVSVKDVLAQGFEN